jgi:hypothetical protein
MKTKTYPEIGLVRLRDVIGDKDNPGKASVQHPMQTLHAD